MCVRAEQPRPSRFAARTGRVLDGRDLVVIEQAEVLYRDFARSYEQKMAILAEATAQTKPDDVTVTS
ncbi:hypothetical protein [Streptomyces sp. NPDC102437]|uniref:hypothetical protein n=1 Tax=Streptomyces sp. NPDC102437 TaxID=3366175 RepID=UPI00381F84E1